MRGEMQKATDSIEETQEAFKVEMEKQYDALQQARAENAEIKAMLSQLMTQAVSWLQSRNAVHFGSRRTTLGGTRGHKWAVVARAQLKA